METRIAEFQLQLYCCSKVLYKTIITVAVMMLSYLSVNSALAQEPDWGRPPDDRFNPRATDMSEVEDVCKRFMANPAPLTDEQLMGDFIGSREEVFAAVFEHCLEMNDDQLRALVKLAAYFDRRSYHNHQSEEPLWELIFARNNEKGILYKLAEESRALLYLEFYGWPELKHYRSQLAMLITLCGGADAIEFLEQMYEPAYDQSLEPASAPYNLRAAFLEREPFERSPAVVTGSGEHVFAYVDPGLIGNAICLAIDDNADGLVDRCLPTGQSDVFRHDRILFPGGIEGETLRKSDLTLSMPQDLAGEIVLGHHRLLLGPRDPQEEYDYVPNRLLGNEFIETSLAADDILRDSDGDGLTDILESYMFTDPLLQDTDGDGFDDANDRYPQSNPEHCGKLERGIARAMIVYSYDLAVSDTDGYDPPEELEWFSWPFRNEYWLISGAKEIPGFQSYHARDWPDYFQRLISLVNEEQQARFTELLAFATNYRHGYIEIFPIDPDSRQAMHGDEVLEHFGERITYEQGDYLVRISPGGSGHEVVLVELDGELYPILSYGTWIS